MGENNSINNEINHNSTIIMSGNNQQPGVPQVNPHNQHNISGSNNNNSLHHLNHNHLMQLNHNQMTQGNNANCVQMVKTDSAAPLNNNTIQVPLAASSGSSSQNSLQPSYDNQSSTTPDNNLDNHIQQHHVPLLDYCNSSLSSQTSSLSSSASSMISSNQLQQVPQSSSSHELSSSSLNQNMIMTQANQHQAAPPSSTPSSSTFVNSHINPVSGLNNSQSSSHSYVPYNSSLTTGALLTSGHQSYPGIMDISQYNPNITNMRPQVAAGLNFNTSLNSTSDSSFISLAPSTPVSQTKHERDNSGSSQASSPPSPDSPATIQTTADYLSGLLKDRKQLQAFPNVFQYLERLLDDEISKVRRTLFQFSGTEKKNMVLPEAEGPVITRSEKVYVPVKDHPEFNFVGRILGPRGMTAKQLETETGCKIMVRGRGSMRDRKKEEANRGKPNWEHLNDELHVLITCEDTANRCQVKMARAIDEIKDLLKPVVDGEDEIKKRQLIELAIINGTYRDSQSKAENEAMKQMMQQQQSSPLRTPQHPLGAPLILPQFQLLGNSPQFLGQSPLGPPPLITPGGERLFYAPYGDISYALGSPLNMDAYGLQSAEMASGNHLNYMQGGNHMITR